MAFHAFSREDTSCEQAWRQAAPAQLRLPRWLHGGQEDTPQPGLHPKPVLPSGAGGGTQRERPCPARDGFWCSPGAVLTPRLFPGLHLTEKMWRSFSPVWCVTLASPGCISKAASAPWFALLRSLGSLICNTRRCLSSSGSPCASVPVPIQPAPALPTCFCHKAFMQKYFS